MPSRHKQPRQPPEHLKTWRVYRKLTLEQVANIIGVGPQAVHKWETGKTPVTLEILQMLASCYGTKPDRLLFNPADKATPEAMQRAYDIITTRPPEAVSAWLAAGEAYPSPSPSPEEK